MSSPRHLAAIRGADSRSAEALLEEHDYRGFPIVRTERDRLALGYISRADLQDALGALALLPRRPIRN